MIKMFSFCYIWESLDLSSFNTEKVENMTEMFSYCSYLSSLNLRNFDMSAVKEKDKMFENCPAQYVVDINY